MSSFAAVNANGAYYTQQESSPHGLDPFAAIGLRAYAEGLTQRGARAHTRLALRHVFERSGHGTDIPQGGLTTGEHCTQYVELGQ